jgi:hypothetical protein
MPTAAKDSLMLVLALVAAQLETSFASWAKMGRKFGWRSHGKTNGRFQVQLLE